MKLTTKGRYAVMAMADLASYADQRPISLTGFAALLIKPSNQTSKLKRKKLVNI